MSYIRLLAKLILIISILSVSACKPQPADCSREDVFCVGLVTAYEGVEDNGLNQAAWKTLQNIVAQAKIARLDNIESIDLRDWEKNTVFFADNGYDVIVTVGSNLSATTITVAAKYPAISFIGIDQELDDVHENIATITFAEDEAGFLAGMLAAKVSTSGKVGAICETSGINGVWQYCEGFRAGAVYEEEDINVTVVYRENGDRDKTFNDPEWGQQKMQSLIDDGVDTMTAFGGNTAQGAFLAASENSVLVIGSEEDLYYRLPDVQAVLVTSIFNDPEVELSSLVLRVSQGEAIFGAHAGQIAFAPFRAQFEAAIEIQLEMDHALQRIRNGTIEIDLPDKK